MNMGNCIISIRRNVGVIIRFRFASHFDYYDLSGLWNQEFGYVFPYSRYFSKIGKECIRILVAECKKKVVGAVVIETRAEHFENYDSYFLTEVCVLPAFQRNHIGFEMFNIIKLLAKKEGIHSIELTCADYRKKAHQFYLNSGYAVKKTKVFVQEIY